MMQYNLSNPWKTLSSKIAYKNPWITLREDQVITPAGKEGIYGVVECKIATGVVAVTKDGGIILVGQYRYTMDEYSWEIIEGGTEIDENPEFAAQRELKEEAGLISSNFIQLGPEIHLSNSHSNERALLYLATELESVPAEPEDTEILSIKEVSYLEAVELIENGGIKDALSIIGIYRAGRKLNLI
jgi:8-oxo-dGTP pyrophosphatase MutT (NUDIX family)